MNGGEDFLYGMDLEQKCQAPGRWLIEGYTVVRRQAMGEGVIWQIRPTPGAPAVTTKRTLRGCREWIATQIQDRKANS